MLRPRTIRNRFLASAVLLFFLGSASVPAHAVSKEIIQLQTQVQQLLDMVQRLQSTLDQRFTVIQNLAQQTADAANKTTAAMNELQQKMNTQNDTVNGKLDTASGQAQSLNDSVDELKSRIAKLDKTVQDLQTQLQNMQQPPPGSVPPGGVAPGGDAGQPGAAQQPGGAMQPGPGGPGAGAGQMPAGPAPAANQAPPLQETYEAALRDYNAARYPLAAQEFGDVVHYYPLDDLAGTAQFYLGEIAYQAQDYAKAINAYNAVLEGFAGNAKAPAAELHKGLALLSQNKKDAGIRELRELVQRHPQTPEARVARSKLNGMGVRINPGSTQR
jgi:TolA-binding protein